ncbi:archaellin/type IV pilin N-terminal domain-containing protein [Aciduricibacillus chroicocephali]
MLPSRIRCRSSSSIIAFLLFVAITISLAITV